MSDVNNFAAGGGNALLRRRMMMDTKPTQDWDVAWDYTMGLPEENGFEKYVQGAPTIVLTDDGVHIVNNRDYYVRYQPSEIEFQTCNEGIYEVEVIFQTLPNVSGVAGFRMILSDGDLGCQISTDLVPNPAIMYDISAQLVTGGLTKIKDIDYNVNYIFRIERIDQLNKIYLNNELIYQSENPSNSYVAGNRIFFQGYPLDATLKSIKFKKLS